jgi:hypothetical protein
MFFLKKICVFAAELAGARDFFEETPRKVPRFGAQIRAGIVDARTPPGKRPPGEMDSGSTRPRAWRFRTKPGKNPESWAYRREQEIIGDG